jgi:hypothetical protein
LLEAVGAELAVLRGGAAAAGAEVVADGAEGLEKLLGVLRRLEPLEHPFSFPHRAMRVLRAGAGV